MSMSVSIVINNHDYASYLGAAMESALRRARLQRGHRRRRRLDGRVPRRHRPLRPAVRRC